MKRRSAITLFRRPCATIRTISISLGVRVSPASRAAVRAAAQEMEIIVPLEQLLEPLQHDGMIVDEHEADRHHRSSSLKFFAVSTPHSRRRYIRRYTFSYLCVYSQRPLALRRI